MFTLLVTQLEWFENMSFHESSNIPLDFMIQ